MLGGKVQLTARPAVHHFPLGQVNSTTFCAVVFRGGALTMVRSGMPSAFPMDALSTESSIALMADMRSSSDVASEVSVPLEEA